MLFQVLLACIIGKYKGYNIKKALIKPAFFPFYFVGFVYIVLQISIMLKNYSFIQYASYLKTANLYSLLIPIFVYKLYKPAIVGSGFIAVGTILNQIVMKANGGKMPVFPTLSRLTGYFSEEAIKNSSLHILGGSETKLKILSDYIDIGYSVLSIGDLFVHLFAFIVFFYGMKAVSTIYDGGK